MNDPAKNGINIHTWTDRLTFISGHRSCTVTRRTAFLLGLCDGVEGQLPPIVGGMRQGCGRKSINPSERKIAVTVWPQQKTVDMLGGKDKVRKLLNNFLNQHI